MFSFDCLKVTVQYAHVYDCSCVGAILVTCMSQLFYYYLCFLFFFCVITFCICFVISLNICICYCYKNIKIKIDLLLIFDSVADVNECSSNPCKNGASCHNNQNSYSCTCAAGWTGTTCTTGKSIDFIC